MTTPRIGPSLAVALAALTVGAVPAAGSAGVYAGDTSTDDAFVLFTKGGRPDFLVVAFRANCASGQSFAFHRAMKRSQLRVTPRAGGRFTAVHRASTQWGALELTVVGRITARRAEGTLIATLQSATDPCTTDYETWQAKRSLGRVYGGATSQGEPITIRRSGNRITHVDFDWHADCAPSGYADIPDGFWRFRIGRTGRFGDDWTWTDRNGRRFDRRFHGRLTRFTGKGTFRATMTVAQGSCTTPPLTWMVASG